MVCSFVGWCLSTGERAVSGFDREKLDAMVSEGWLRSARHPEADLWIFNYTEKTQYENHWTPETLACRGLILDADGQVVARPFSKFFNYGTPEATVPAEQFTVTEKVDGSLGILYYLDGEPRIATRGSFTSDQAKVGTELLDAYDFEHADGQTPLFEIVYPENRIVVDYGGRRELVLLGVIENETGREVGMRYWSGPRVATLDHDDIATLADFERPNQEGFVVAFESGHRVKVKFSEYVRLHKIVTGVNARMIWESLRDGVDLASLLDGVPDEIYDWITATRADLQRAYDLQHYAAADVFSARPETDDRKALAAYFTTSDANPAVLFRMLDGKPFDDLIWKAIKPGHVVPSPSSSTSSSDTKRETET